MEPNVFHEGAPTTDLDQPFPKVGEEEEDSVIEMVYEGKKYLKSVISGVVYDMDENEIGAWKNDKIVLNDSSGSEEEEEEYN